MYHPHPGGDRRDTARGKGSPAAKTKERPLAPPKRGSSHSPGLGRDAPSPRDTPLPPRANERSRLGALGFMNEFRTHPPAARPPPAKGSSEETAGALQYPSYSRESSSSYSLAHFVKSLSKLPTLLRNSSQTKDLHIFDIHYHQYCFVWEFVCLVLSTWSLFKQLQK